MNSFFSLMQSRSRYNSVPPANEITRHCFQLMMSPERLEMRDASFTSSWVPHHMYWPGHDLDEPEVQNAPFNNRSSAKDFVSTRIFIMHKRQE
jgi:hypothetical protein